MSGRVRDDCGEAVPSEQQRRGVSGVGVPVSGSGIGSRNEVDGSCRAKAIRVVSLVQAISCIAVVHCSFRAYRSARCVKERCRVELESGVEKRALFDGLATCGAEGQASRKERNRRMTNVQSGLRGSEVADSGRQRNVEWDGDANAGCILRSLAVHLMIQRQERWNAGTLGTPSASSNIANTCCITRRQARRGVGWTKERTPCSVPSVP